MRDLEEKCSPAAWDQMTGAGLPYKPLDEAWWAAYLYFVEQRPAEAPDTKDVERLVIAVGLSTQRSRPLALARALDKYAVDELRNAPQRWPLEDVERGHFTRTFVPLVCHLCVGLERAIDAASPARLAHAIRGVALLVAARPGAAIRNCDIFEKKATCRAVRPTHPLAKVLKEVVEAACEFGLRSVGIDTTTLVAPRDVDDSAQRVRVEWAVIAAQLVARCLDRVVLEGSLVFAQDLRRESRADAATLKARVAACRADPC